MFCPHCGVPSDNGTILCKHCGVTLSVNAVLTDVHEPPQSSVLQVRPWVRYWARMFDISLYAIVIGLMMGAFFPNTIWDKKSELGAQLLIVFSWAFLESLLLSFFGTTPGKALFRIRLSLEGKDSIPFDDAFERSVKVWWRGLGAGVPFVALFTLSRAETVLSRDGITSWDRDLGFKITNQTSPTRSGCCGR
jgi:hypothetical protein